MQGDDKFSEVNKCTSYYLVKWTNEKKNIKRNAAVLYHSKQNLMKTMCVRIFIQQASFTIKKNVFIILANPGICKQKYSNQWRF